MNGSDALEDALEALELAADLDDLDMSEEEEAYLDEDATWDEDAAILGEVLLEALHEDYAGALPEELDAALDNIFDSMSPAESFNIGKALRQIGKGASQAVADPLVGQVVRTALPIAGGAVGTLVGGPAGTAVGGALGSAAAKALPSTARASAPRTAARMASSPPPTMSPAARAPVSAGSAAAAQGLALTQHPDVLKSLLALALGGQGRQAINGVPVGAVMNMLSSVFGRAAEDADELRYGGDESSGYLHDSEAHPDIDPAAPADRARALYARLIGSENRRLAEATAQ